MCYYRGHTRQACESRERALAELAAREEQLEEQARTDKGQDEPENPERELRKTAA